MRTVMLSILASALVASCTDNERATFEDASVPEPTGEQHDAAAAMDARLSIDAARSPEASVVDAEPQDATLDAAPDAAIVDAAIVDAAEPVDASTCPSPTRMCGGSCLDVRGDVKNYGGCGVTCPSGFGCHDMQCQAEVGCSDGSREAFASAARFPTIAGCSATWQLGSLRAEPTGAACGDTRGQCAVPADACAAGWHVCGNSPRGGADLSTRVTHAECYAEKGRFAVALGDHSCTDCGPDSSGAVCCGDGCLQQEGNCVWPAATGWFGVVNDVINTCDAIENKSSNVQTGVLCCRTLTPN